MSALNSKGEKLFQLFWTIFFILITCIAMVPILRVISMSFSAKEAINASRVTILPIGFNTEAYVKSFQSGSFARAFGYSIMLMLASTVVNLVMTVLAAYPLSKKNLVGGSVIMTMFVLTMYLNPGVIPEYLNVRDFKLIDTVWALIIPGALSAYNMIIMCNSFRGIDSAIYEAAKIDGAGPFRIYWNVILPNIRPAIGSIGIFTAMMHWNDYLNPLLMLNDMEKMTLPLGLVIFDNQRSMDLSATMAAATLIMLPMIVIFLIFQKQFIKGMTMSGIK